MADQRIKFVGEYTDKGLKAGLSGATKSLKEMQTAMASVAAVSKQKYEAQQKAAAEAAAKHKEKIDNLKKSLQNFAAGAAIAGVALKKVYDTARQGAELEYTASKFDRLAASIGTTSDALMNDLAVATRGMYSEAETMALAGDLMALGLANTHDEAVRLTSVAAGLGMNMNQLVLTLTNMTTMRFDALGISVAGFDEKVKALTDSGMAAEEAFRVAFMEQGEEAIERVGHVADTSLGSFMKMEASIKDLGDAFKMALAPAVSKAAEAITLFLNLNDNVAETADQIARSGVSYDAYITMMRRLGEETGHVVTTTEEYAKIMDAGGWGSTWSDRILVLTQAEYELQQQVKDSHEEWRLYGDVVDEATDTALEAAQANEELTTSFDDVERGLARVIEQWKADLKWIEEGGLTFQAAVLRWQEATENAALAGEDYTFEMAMLNKEMFSYVALTAKVEQMDLGEIQRQFEGLGLETNEAATAAALLYNKFNGIEGLTVDSITQQLVDMGVPIEEASVRAEEILQALTGLDGMSIESFIEIFKTTYERTVKGWSSGGASVPKPSQSNKPKGASEMQAGGNFVVPPSWTGDSFPVRATAGERVQVGTKSSTMDEMIRRRVEERRRDENLARMIADAVLVGVRG